MPMRRHVRVLACLALASLAPAHSAQPDGPAPTSPAHPAILSWQLNGLPQGDAVVLLQGDDVLMGPEALAAAGLTLSPIARVRINDQPYVSLARLGTQLSYARDDQAGTLTLQAQPGLFGATRVDFDPDAPAGIEYRLDPSAFLNYAPRLMDGERFEAYAEAGASAGGLAAFSGVSHSPEIRAVRGLSHLTYHDRERLLSWQLGDGFRGAGGLGGHVLLGGLTFSRDLTLDPYHRGAPGLGYSGAVDTPSTVDVYVNDALVRTERIAPGAFTLENLPLTTGAGAVRYEIRDALGRRQAFESGYYLAPGLLRAGETDFSYSVGVRRLDQATASAHYDDRLAGIGRQRVGLTDRLTVSWGLEGDPAGAAGGPSLAIGLPAGALAVAISGSRIDGVGGVAGLLGYGYQGRRLSASASVRGASDHYAHLGLTPQADRRRVDASAALNVSLSQRLTAGLQQRAAVRRDVGLSLDSVASVSAGIDDSVSLRVTGTRSQIDPNQPIVWTVFANLAGTFDLGLSGRVGSTADDQGTRQMDVGLSRPLPQGAGLGFDAHASLHQTQVNQGDLTARGQGRAGRALARFVQQGEAQHLLLEAAGGVAWVAGGGVHLSQPLHRAFAVVEVPNVEGAHIRLANNPVARTGANGRALVPGLLPNYGNRLTVDTARLPLDRRIETAERLVAPAWRGGARTVMGIVRALFVRGRLLMRGPNPDTVPRFGTLVLRQGATQHTSPLGEDGAFELADLPAGQYRGLARTGDGRRCLLDLTVPEPGDGPVLDLGLVECVEVASARRDPRRTRRTVAARGRP